MKKLIIAAIISVFIVTGCKKAADQPKNFTLEEAKTFVAGFINENLVQPGNEVSIKEVMEENSLYKVVVNMKNGQEVTSYISKDGKKFFPQVYDIDEIESKKQESQSNAQTPPATTVSVKTEKPKIELFVMSYCPYGTQIEKGILPVLDTLGDKVDFNLNFCDYAMHGKKEVDEELNQVCIRDNEPEKLKDYLYCFLDAGDGAGCLDKVGINKSQLTSCVASIDKEFEVTKLYEDQSTWKSGQFPQFNVDGVAVNNYGVSGSPTLVINGEKIQAQRDSASLLATICSAFSSEPEECATQLSSTSPSSGFGFNAGGSNGDASCDG